MMRVGNAGRWLVATAILGTIGAIASACIEEIGPLPSRFDSGTAGDATTDGGANFCGEYCTVLSSRCTGPNQVFSKPEACQRMCALTEQGAEGDTNKNTVGCRLPQAKAGGTQAVCGAAGPFGCGEPCNTFCDLVESNCITPFANRPDAQPYPSHSSCIEACRNFAFEDAGPLGLASTVERDTLNCRMYHLILSLPAADQLVHCQHVRPISDTCKNRDAAVGGG